MIVERGSDPPPDKDEPLILGPELLRKPQPSEVTAAASPRPVDYRPEPSDLQLARRTTNECIYFDERHGASWIIYPPRSAYTFVPRSGSDVTVVEYRRWTPMTPSMFHQLTVLAGCAEHGVDCPSTVALSVAVKDGYDPFK